MKLAASSYHLLQKSALMQAFAGKWFRLAPQVRHGLPQGSMQNLMQVDVPAVSHGVERIVDALMVVVHISIAAILLCRYLGSTAIAGLVRPVFGQGAAHAQYRGGSAD